MALHPIEVGAVAPDFSLPSNHLTPEGKPGKPYTLSQLKGKNVVLAFYPLDFSPVCSTEHTCLRSDAPQFNGVNAQVLGISVDSAWTHKAFAEKMGVEYPLLADFNPKGAVASKFGLYYDDKGFTARATVIVDKHGKVAYVKVQEIGQARDDAEILKALESLK
jgi:peroxiredoxin